MSDLVLVEKLERDLKSLDMTGVVKYTEKLQDISKGLNTMLAPLYLRDFILAYDITNGLLSKAMYYLGQAEAALKTAESIAYFDNAPEFLEQRSVKDTAEARKKYVPLDPAVQKAEQVRARAEAMVSFLKNKLQEFRLAHDDVKKIAYANDNNNSPNEGM